MSFWKRIFGHSGDNKARTPSPKLCNPDDPTQSPCTPPLASPPADTTNELIGKDRVIRVFISSTFRDMHLERELLVKQVFPELRRLCAERFVTFTEVDLRWGITEEQAAEGKVLPICLEEIQRSRPYFIGLLGERYGWIPESVPPEVMTREPWLKQHVGGRTSVTELEILHGVLNNPAMSKHAFFYFRSPAYLASVPEKERADFATENPESQEKLQNLKDRIRRSGLPLLENYAAPEALAAAVRQQFIKLIDHLYPKEELPDSLDQEALGHEAYARSKLLAYVEHPAHTAALDKFVRAESTGRGLVLTGESGGGKTALLAAWVRHWQESHPDDFVLPHYFGATPESASVDGFLRRLLGELKRRYEITDEIPVEPNKLRETLPLWLAQTIGRGRIVLVLDALNQIEGEEPDRRLGWLPRHFPPHVCVLASTWPGPALENLRERGWSEHLLLPPDVSEREWMISTFLDHYRKTLQPKFREQVAGAPGSANPLFLRTVLEELRQFGSFEQLPDRVAHFLEAASPEELFRLVLRRWQEDFDGGRDLVRCSLSHLWAARQGLAETEWLELLGTTEQALPRQEWTPLFYAMEPHLAQRAGLYAFGHDFLRQAVEAEYLSSPGAQNEAHLALANYFERQRGITSRKAAEWPWQLRAAEAWERLEATLTDLDLFIALYNERPKWELTGYWLPLRQQGRNMEKCCAGAYERRASGNAHLAYSLGAFLIENGCYRTGKALTEKAAASSKASSGSLGEFDANYITSQANLALLLEAQGDFTSAAAIRELVLSTYELSFGKRDRYTAISCLNLAGTYLQMGRGSDAERLVRRAIDIDEQIYGTDHPEVATDLISLAECLRSDNKLCDAEAVLRRALSICRNHLPSKHPLLATILSNLATILVQSDRSQDAEPLALEAVEIDRECLGNENPKLATRLNNLAMVIKANGRIGGALMPAQEALEILVKHSVRAGVPHRNIKAVAITLASLATETGLPQPLVIKIVNNILCPLRDIGKEPVSGDTSLPTNTFPKMIGAHENPAQIDTAIDNDQVSDRQGRDDNCTELKNDIGAEGNQIDSISQLLVQLDPAQPPISSRSW